MSSIMKALQRLENQQKEGKRSLQEEILLQPAARPQKKSQLPVLILLVVLGLVGVVAALVFLNAEHASNSEPLSSNRKEMAKAVPGPVGSIPPSVPPREVEPEPPSEMSLPVAIISEESSPETQEIPEEPNPPVVEPAPKTPLVAMIERHEEPISKRKPAPQPKESSPPAPPKLEAVPVEPVAVKPEPEPVKPTVAEATEEPEALVIATAPEGEVAESVVPAEEPVSPSPQRPAQASKDSVVPDAKPEVPKPTLETGTENQSETVPHIQHLAVPDFSIKRTVWHPIPARRVAVILLAATEEAIHVGEGDSMGPLIVKEIKPSRVVFLHGEVEIERRVGAQN